MIKKVIFTVACLAISAQAFAWGPFYIYPKDKGGDAYTWKNNTIVWQYDSGALSDTIPNAPSNANKESCKKDTFLFLPSGECNLTQCGVVLCVEALFKKWQESALPLGYNNLKAKVVNLKTEKGAAIPVDITTDNFSLKDDGKTYSTAVEQGAVIFVFDKDGSILQQVTESGKEPPLGISNSFASSKSKYYNGGYVILNGKKANMPNYTATIMHEIGHLLGLDHSQPQMDVTSGNAAGTVAEEAGITTMYPKLLNAAQNDLHFDDMTSLAMLYPSQDFLGKFCKIEGKLIDKSNKQLWGVNVIAYAEGEQYVDARSFVTGALSPPCSQDGSYLLGGIVPGKAYKVIYEPVFSDFQNFATGMNPYNEDECDLLPTLTTSGYVVDASGNQMVACSASISGAGGTTVNGDLLASVVSANGVSADSVSITGGKTIEMKDSTLDAELKEQEETSGEDGGKKGWCNVAVGGVANLPGALIFILTPIGILISRRFRGQKN